MIMLDGLLTVLSGLFGFVGGLLPTSPFAEWAAISENLRMGLGWLNWFCPIGTFSQMLVAWIALAAAVTALKMFLNAGGNVAEKVLGGVS